MCDQMFCKYCQCDHPLTRDWWYFRKDGYKPRCKIHVQLTQKRTQTPENVTRQVHKSYQIRYQKWICRKGLGMFHYIFQGIHGI